MTQTFKIKRGDTSPAIQIEISPADLNVIGATAVFNMKRHGGAVVISRATAVIVTGGDAPILRYNWSATDTDETGLYVAEFEVTYADSTVETFPNGESLAVSIPADIA